MLIDFANAKLRTLCEAQREAERRLGADCARKLRSRLADIEAAADVSRLTAGRPHPLQGERRGQFALDLAGGVRLVFEPDHAPCPRHADGAVDWTQVTSIRIVFIGDYHD